MSSIADADNILSELKKEVLKEITREKTSRFTRIVKNEATAKNYAKAMFDAADELGKIEIIKNDLNIVYSSLLADDEVFNFFKSNFIDGNLRMNLLKKVYSNKISEEAFNLISILVERDLIGILYAIIIEYENLCNEYYNIVTVKVITSTEIKDSNIMESLNNKIKDMVNGKDIHFIYNTDESIMGGVIIEIEDTIYDYSVRRLLTELKTSITNIN